MKIRALGAELFHAVWRTDGRTDGHDEDKNRFSQCGECANNTT